MEPSMNLRRLSIILLIESILHSGYIALMPQEQWAVNRFLQVISTLYTKTFIQDEKNPTKNKDKTKCTACEKSLKVFLLAKYINLFNTLFWQPHFKLFLPGNILLHLLRAKIIQICRTTSTDWGPIREMLGEYLFTLQEFYSNTNWVEMSGSKPYTELGRYFSVTHQYMQSFMFIVLIQL